LYNDYYFPSYLVLRDKGELQLNIRSLKETNLALSAINKGLEETLFKVRSYGSLSRFDQSACFYDREVQGYPCLFFPLLSLFFLAANGRASAAKQGTGTSTAATVTELFPIDTLLA